MAQHKQKKRVLISTGSRFLHASSLVALVPTHICFYLD